MELNGIDTAALDAFSDELAATPDAGAMSVRVRSRWEHAYTTRTDTEEVVVADERVPRHNMLTVDLPTLFGGRDKGPAPGELLLAALGACVTQGFAEVAALRGITIDRMELTLEGRLDLRGAAGIDGIRAGLTGVRLALHVAARATSQELEEILEVALTTSPVADTLVRGISIDTEVHAAAHATTTDQAREG